ncbi:hypothetical protein D5086_009967 [Populus alba]|uniref:Uncharacterized protein n=1 Tax=Populus alba TaxID=43335 RepID=A0ACC4CAN9_POPAL
MLSNATLDSLYPLRSREVRNTIKYIYSHAGSPINVGDQLFLAVFNVVTSMLWGGTVHGKDRASSGAEFRGVVAEMTELLSKPNVSDFFPSLARFDLQGVVKKMRGLAMKLEQIFEKMIDERLKVDEINGTRDAARSRSTECEDFLGFLLKLKDEGDPKTPLTMTHVKALLMDMVVGGTETSSNSVDKWDYTGSDLSYFPFGSGRRSCAGIAMAERMFMYFLATLLHCFDWELPEGKEPDLSEKFGIVIKLNNPLVLIPAPRLPDPNLYE